MGIGEDQKLGLQTSCKSSYRATPLSLQEVWPAEFIAGKPDPIKGAWMIRYRLDRCGDSKVYNAVLLAQAGGPPAIQPFFPGSTRANVKLLQDAMPPALTQAWLATEKKACPTPYVFDMQSAAPTTEVTKRTWDELWTFSVCGSLVDVPITFTLDEDGTGASFHSSQGTLRRSAQGAAH